MSESAPPRKTSGRTPDYPTAALRPQQQGAVTVSMVITATGEPAELSVVESAGPALDAAVLNALQTWCFEPARKNGIKVRVRWKQTFSFVVK